MQVKADHRFDLIWCITFPSIQSIKMRNRTVLHLASSQILLVTPALNICRNIMKVDLCEARRSAKNIEHFIMDVALQKILSSNVLHVVKTSKL